MVNYLNIFFHLNKVLNDKRTYTNNYQDTRLQWKAIRVTSNNSPKPK
jgi:hypothetical protein